MRTATTSAVLAAIAAAAVAACSSGQPATAPTVTSSPPATAHPAGAIGGNITIAPAGTMAPGPMKITPVYCGKFTAAQRTRYGTTAAGGFIYRYANQSDTLQASAKLSVSFTNGSTVLADNVTGSDAPVIGPGQHASAEVDALGDSGQDLTFKGCEVMSYALVTNSGIDPVSYAG